MLAMVMLPPNNAVGSEFRTHRREEQLEATRRSADLEHQARERRPTLIERMRAFMRRRR
jgi:hypothetical protein